MAAHFELLQPAAERQRAESRGCSAPLCLCLMHQQRNGESERRERAREGRIRERSQRKQEKSAICIKQSRPDLGILTFI